MGTSLDKALDGYEPGVAAVYLADYLQPLSNWSASTTFDRERFSDWLKGYTRAAGAYGLELVLKGLDQLVTNGHLAKKGDNELKMTLGFVGIMQQHFQR